MCASPISKLIGSSQCYAIADDAMKDEDNAAWIMELEPSIRQEWIERSHWIRLVDRLAENDLIHPGASEFDKFHESWQWLLQTGEVRAGCPYQNLFNAMRDRWLTKDFQRSQCLSVLSWDRYLWAIKHYHAPHLRIETLDQYERMLQDVGGTFFQVFPFLSPEYWRAAFHLGTLDQFYNNLRDLQEDAQQGLCYLPNRLLQQFGVHREEILQSLAYYNPGYHRMMEFLLDGYLPQLHQKTNALLTASDLHPSWQILRDWSFHRYRRIERTFRKCDFNYNQFPQVYWAKVKQELESSS
jgi:phytoene synthase